MKRALLCTPPRRLLNAARTPPTTLATHTTVHRSGATLTQDVSAIKLAAGDLLVLEAGPGFAAATSSSRAFTLISEVPNSAPLKSRRMWVALLLVVAMVATQIIGGAIDNEVINLWPAAMLTIALMLVTKCMNTDQARASIDWEVYVW